MGLRFYIGASGSGKSYQLYNHIIQQSMANPHINYLIVVPDQFTMQTQLEMVMRHPNKGIMNIDVLSFGRLSHRIFEEVGGNDKPVLDDTGKSLVLRRVAAGLEDELGVMKRNIRKPGYISEVKSALSEFMQYGLGTKEVEKLCEYAAKRNALAYKLKDLHLLYEGFLNYINERYITTEETLDLLRKVLPRSKVVKGSVIVFDGFTGFTPVQYNVIQELMVQAQELIVTVTMGAEENAYVQDGEQKLFHLSKKTIHDLDRRCKDAGVRREADERITDSVVYRYRDNAGLAHLERALFRYPVQEYQGTQDSIRLFEASAPKEELRQVCIFTMGPFLISAIWLIFGGGSIFKQEIKKFEAKLASDGFKRNQTFYGKGKYVAIDLEKGEIALLFFWNPFKAYIIPAGHIENAWVSDGRSGSGIMEGSQRVSFFFIVDGIKIRVDTFTSNQRQRMDSDYILTGISKADMMVKMLAQARANSKEV